MNNGISLAIGFVLGAVAGAGATYVVMNKRHEQEMNDFVNDVRVSFSKERDNIIMDLNKEAPGTRRKRREQAEREEQARKELAESQRIMNKIIDREEYVDDDEDEDEEYDGYDEDPDVYSAFDGVHEAPDHGPGPDPEDPDALYPISERELSEYIDNGEDPEDLLLSAEGELHFPDFRPYDSPYIFDGIDIKSLFGKYTGDDGVAYFRDPVSNISYRVYKSLKSEDEMYQLMEDSDE